MPYILIIVPSGSRYNKIGPRMELWSTPHGRGAEDELNDSKISFTQVRQFQSSTQSKNSTVLFPVSVAEHKSQNS